MVKVAVLVSGGGTNLQALIDAQQAGEHGRAQHDDGREGDQRFRFPPQNPLQIVNKGHVGALFIIREHFLFPIGILDFQKIQKEKSARRTGHEANEEQFQRFVLHTAQNSTPYNK